MKLTLKPANYIIRCPHCGYEYLPGEIFVANSFFGKPVDIIRDALGKIIYEDYEDGEEPELTEHFTCENCDNDFVIEASPTYKSRPEDEELDFKTQFTSLLDD